MKRKENSKADINKNGAANNEKPIFLLDDGKLVPFEPEQYTASVLYQMMESFTVECKLVRPNDPTNLQYEGKRPSKKTIPILVMKDEKCVLLDSWEDLEANPEQLSDVIEVMGAVPVKQVFVLKRK